MLNGVGQSETITEYKIFRPMTIKAGEYILSGKAIRSEGVSKALCTIRFYVSGSDYTQFNFKCDNEKFSENINLQKDYNYIALYAGPFHAESIGITTIFTDLMLRPASITDDTYESYKPSVDERLGSVENDKRLNNGDDLNNVINLGRYSARDYDVAQSILNTPIARANMKPFCVEVSSYEYSTGRVIIQKLYYTNSFDGIMYIRNRLFDGSSWGSWYKFTGTTV